MKKARKHRIAVTVVSAFCAGIAGGSAMGADNSEWTLRLEPMYMDGFGNDRQVLRVQELELGAVPSMDTSTPVALDTEATLANRFTVQYSREDWKDWTFGLDFIFFGTAQGRPTRSAAADGAAGPINEVIFEVGDRSFTSDDPAEALSFNVVTDTDMEAWTMDLYGIRTLAEAPERKLALVLGLRNADFDNDYHSVVGIDSVNGSLVDASSNYDSMQGPLLGLIGEIQLGKNTLTGYFSQSVVFGSTNLSRTISDFIGPAGDSPSIVAQEYYRDIRDVSIPITELRVRWMHPVSRHFSVGATASASIWSDVPVPPMIEPGTTGGLDKNTIVFFGLGAALEYRF